VNKDRKLTSVDHREGDKNRPEGGARAKPMHEKDREDREDKARSLPLRPSPDRRAEKSR
jgi:hypothetical protein